MKAATNKIAFVKKMQDNAAMQYKIANEIQQAITNVVLKVESIGVANVKAIFPTTLAIGRLRITIDVVTQVGKYNVVTTVAYSGVGYKGEQPLVDQPNKLDEEVEDNDN